MTSVVGQPFVALGPQDPVEQRIITFDFAAVVLPGETLSAPVVTVNEIVGDDCDTNATLGADVTATLIHQAATVSGNQVQQLVGTGGTLSVNYMLTCKVSTSLGQVLALSASMLISKVMGVAT